MFGKLFRRAPAPSATASVAAPTTGVPAALVELVGQQRVVGAHLDKKALHLAALRARPLGWTNSLPVVLRPTEDSWREPALQQARSPRAADSLPTLAPGTPLWHRQPE